MIKYIHAVALSLVVMFGSHLNAAEEESKAPKQDSAVAPSAVTLQDYYKHVAMPKKKMGDVVKIGEKLVYRVQWKGAPAGEVTFRARRETAVRGRPALYFSMETESNDAVSLIYKIRDKVKSYVDAETGHSLLYVRNIREGTYKKYKADDYLEFDYDTLQQNYTSIKKKGEKKKQYSRPIPGPVQDPLSVLYYLRNFPLTMGAKRQVLVGSRKRTNILIVKVKQEKELKLSGLGRFDAFEIELGNGGAAGGKYDPNIFKSKGDVSLWVEKHTNIPLMVVVDVPVLGNVRAVLISIENSDLKDHLKK